MKHRLQMSCIINCSLFQTDGLDMWMLYVFSLMLKGSVFIFSALKGPQKVSLFSRNSIGLSVES
jgi:hypothetical protein